VLSKDRRGVVELPFKLVIASIILVITISIAYAGLERFSENAVTDRVDSAVSTIASVAGEVSTMGVNSSMKVKVDLSSSLFHKVERFDVGCGDIADLTKCKSITYKVTGDDVRSSIVKDQAGHDLVLVGKNGKMCTLGDGDHELLIERAQDHLVVSKI
jgi:hypothetical protein